MTSMLTPWFGHEEDKNRTELRPPGGQTTKFSLLKFKVSNWSKEHICETVQKL